MADKFRTTFPISITFGAGEQPTHQKLNAITYQARSGSTLFERAIGDPWNQSADEHLIDYGLQIPNLARIIGENASLNPILYSPGSNFWYRDYLADVGWEYDFVGSTKGRFKYPPHLNTLVDFKPSGAFSGTRHTSLYSLLNSGSSGDYYIYERYFWTYDEIESDDWVEYEVAISNWGRHGLNVLPGVIPDPRQTSFTACRISKTGNQYFLHLPPRCQLYGISGSEKPFALPEYVTGNIDTSVPTPPDLPHFWQFTDNALADEFYRYRLPYEIQNAGLSAGDYIPDGFMYLWDQDEQTIIEDVRFKITGTSYILEIISETNSDVFEAKYSSSEISVAYSNTGVSLITVGAPIARSVQELATAFYAHNHGFCDVGEAVIEHGSLKNTDPPTTDATGQDYYPSNIPAWHASRWINDDHISLLSRVGSQSSSSEYRDRYNNAMLGHLLLANMDENDYLDDDCDDGSYKIYFGNVTNNAWKLGVWSGPDFRIYYGSSYPRLLISSDGRFVLGKGSTENNNVLTINCDESNRTNTLILRGHDGGSQSQLNIAFLLDGATSTGKIGARSISGNDYLVALGSNKLMAVGTTGLELRYGSTSGKGWELDTNGNFIDISGAETIGASGNSIPGIYATNANIDQLYPDQIRIPNGDTKIDIRSSNGVTTFWQFKNTGELDGGAYDLTAGDIAAHLVVTGQTLPTSLIGAAFPASTRHFANGIVATATIPAGSIGGPAVTPSYEWNVEDAIWLFAGVCQVTIPNAISTDSAVSINVIDAIGAVPTSYCTVYNLSAGVGETYLTVGITDDAGTPATKSFSFIIVGTPT